VSDRDLTDAASKMERHLAGLGTIAREEEKPKVEGVAKLLN
jgi:hypothetical protein